MSVEAPPADAAGFARDVRMIGDACAAVLARLNDVLAAQQRSVIALAAAAGVDGRLVDEVNRVTLGSEAGAA
jgi:hypothetical protein